MTPPIHQTIDLHIVRFINSFTNCRITELPTGLSIGEPSSETHEYLIG